MRSVVEETQRKKNTRGPLFPSSSLCGAQKNSSPSLFLLPAQSITIATTQQSTHNISTLLQQLKFSPSKQTITISSSTSHFRNALKLFYDVRNNLIVFAKQTFVLNHVSFRLPSPPDI